MLDRGISIRWILIWAAFGGALSVASMGFYLHSDALGRLAMISAAAGFVLLVLNDNAKTRQVMRVAVREVTDARETARLSSVR